MSAEKVMGLIALFKNEVTKKKKITKSNDRVAPNPVVMLNLLLGSVV